MIIKLVYNEYNLPNYLFLNYISQVIVYYYSYIISTTKI